MPEAERSLALEERLVLATRELVARGEVVQRIAIQLHADVGTVWVLLGESDTLSREALIAGIASDYRTVLDGVAMVSRAQSGEQLATLVATVCTQWNEFVRPGGTHFMSFERLGGANRHVITIRKLVARISKLLHTLELEARAIGGIEVLRVNLKAYGAPSRR